jgi:hypothetical protein
VGGGGLPPTHNKQPTSKMASQNILFSPEDDDFIVIS